MVLLNLQPDAVLTRTRGVLFRSNNSDSTLKKQMGEMQRGKLEGSAQRLLAGRNLENTHQLLIVREFFAAISKEPSDADVTRYHRDPFGLTRRRLPDNVTRQTESQTQVFSTLDVAGGREPMHALAGYSAQVIAISYPQTVPQ